MRETALTEGIKKAISDCLTNGRSEIDIVDKNETRVTVRALWEPWEVDETYSIVTIYMLEDGIIKFKYQIEETKVYE